MIQNERAASRPIGFHRHRGNRWNPKGVYQRLWSLIDHHPFPPALDRAARLAVYHGQRVRFERTRRRDGAVDPVSRNGVVLSSHSFQRPSVDRAAAAFRAVHEANEALLRPDGTWDAHPMAEAEGAGVMVEEAALRVPGYLGAYEATGVPEYLERAEGAGRHLVRDRLFADGHLHLQVHLVPDLPYAFAGRALLMLWGRDPSGHRDYLSAARKIGDRLLDYPISGSVNHACAPAQFLGPLYRATGERKYLDGAVKRVSRTALAFQLPDGGWSGHESWSWYHAVALSALIETYVSAPFVPARYAVKDRLSGAIAAALNRMVLLQEPTGRIDPMGDSTTLKEREEVGRTFERKSVRFRDGRFERVAAPPVAQPSGYEMDALVTACEGLGVRPEPAYGLGQWLVGREADHRFEFRTLGVGRLLALLARTRAA